jgi:hypothetical protein
MTKINHDSFSHVVTATALPMLHRFCCYNSPPEKA